MGRRKEPKEVTQGVEEAGKMGMIAFYAGLLVGILFGVLFSSLWAFPWRGVRTGRSLTEPRDYPR